MVIQGENHNTPSCTAIETGLVSTNILSSVRLVDLCDDQISIFLPIEISENSVYIWKFIVLHQSPQKPTQFILLLFLVHITPATSTWLISSRVVNGCTRCSFGGNLNLTRNRVITRCFPSKNDEKHRRSLCFHIHPRKAFCI